MEEEFKILEGKTILVVDNDTRHRASVCRYLEQNNMITYTAASGYQSLELLVRNPSIGLALIDMTIPATDGFETIKRIRKNPLLDMIPIISVQADAIKGDREKCLAAGASEYVLRPVIIEDLLKIIANLLNRVNDNCILKQL